MPRCLPILTSFFDRFLMGFRSQLRPLEPQESSPRCSESTIYQKIAFRILHRFFIDFGANMPPFSLQKSTKIASNIDLERHQFFDRFLHRFFIDFCSIWEANLAPCWPLFRSKWGDPIRLRPLFYWVYVLFLFFGRPGPLLAPFGLDFWGVGARFWALFWKVLGSILEASGDNLGLRLLFENRRLLLENLSLSFGSSWKTCSFDPFCWRLVLDGLVGLREAQRILIDSNTQSSHYFLLKRGGGYAALLRFGSAAPGLWPAHGVRSPIL